MIATTLAFSMAPPGRTRTHRQNIIDPLQHPTTHKGITLSHDEQLAEEFHTSRADPPETGGGVKQGAGLAGEWPPPSGHYM